MTPILSAPPPNLLAVSLVAGLLLVLAAVTAGIGSRLAARGATALCLIGCVVSAAVLLVAPEAVAWPLPAGLPGQPVTIGLDGLSATFLLIVFAIGAAAAGAAPPDAPDTGSPLYGWRLMLAVGAAAAALLAQNTIGLLVGAGTAWLAASSTAGDAAMSWLALLAVLAALAILGPSADFAALRGSPVEPWRAAMAMLLTSAGAGAVMASPPGNGGAWRSEIGAALAAYVLLRVILDLAGLPSTWWCVPLLIAGVSAGVLGAHRALREDDLPAVLAATGTAQAGAVLAAIGLAVLARASDLPPLAGTALAAALLLVLSRALCLTLLGRVATAVQRGAGTQALSRLGGLAGRMPVTTAGALVGAAALANLPLGAGFPGHWLLLQALLASPRIGGLPLQGLLALTVAGMALAAGLIAVAAVRLVGIGFLGRPRMPRTAAAEEVKGERTLLVVLSIAASLLGVVPAAALTLLAPALRMLLGASRPISAVPAGWSGIGAQADGPFYAALPLAGLALVLLGAVSALRRGRRDTPAPVPLWDGGEAADVPWLPFGDPATQLAPGSFARLGDRGVAAGGQRLAASGRAILGAAIDAAGTRAVARRPTGAWAALVLLVLLLAWLAVMGAR